MKYEILALEGTDGVIPDEGIEYSVRSGHITIRKNGETILDDEYKTGPSIKYILDGEELRIREGHLAAPAVPELHHEVADAVFRRYDAVRAHPHETLAVHERSPWRGAAD